MKCSACESANTHRLEVVFANGTHSISATSYSAGIGGAGNIGGGFTSTTGQSQSVLASACSPPPKKPAKLQTILLGLGLTPSLLGICLPLTFGGHIPWSLVLVFAAVLSPLWAIGFYIDYSRSKYNKQVWPNLFQRWRESWICYQCGSIFHQTASHEH